MQWSRREQLVEGQVCPCPYSYYPPDCEVENVPSRPHLAQHRGVSMRVVWPQARENSSRGTLAPKDGRSTLGCLMVFLGS